MAKLKVTVGGETFEQELSKPVWIAGRKPELDLPLATTAASREHFKIGRLQGGGWGIQDLGSTNGTLLNDQPVKAAKLSHRDVIRVGKDCTILFLDPPEPEPVEEPPKPKGPLVLKSRAQKEREKEEEERRRRLEERKKVLAEAAANPSEAVEIVDEASLDRLLKEKGRLDELLAQEKQVNFGPYRVLKRLSEGGMGVVFKARHGKLGDVALKVLRAEMVDEKNIARFKQEAWAISAFNHPNIVKVKDLSSHGGMPYIAMDFVNGEDLLAIGFRRDLTFWQVAEVIWKMADVLELVHARNIWHRDIKPQNILMDRTGEIRLIDFGIATIEREQDDSTKTGEGLIMGTPAFLSPEQAARGKMGAIDGRADLYSLGAVMYYLLTGRRPFTGKSAVEILRANMKDPPPHPHTVDELIPDGLVAIALKLLEKDPADRIQTAKELKAQIDAWRKTPDGKEERERHEKILKLRALKAKKAQAEGAGGGT